MSEGHDVAVVGASIAGCTAVTLFARRGARVALIERHSDLDAYKVLCTHFIQPSAIPTMERLGLIRSVEEAGAVCNGGIDMWTRWGWISTPEDVPHGYNLRRSVLDPMLRRLTLETPDVDYMPGLFALRLVRDAGRVSGVEARDRSGRIRTVRARMVVAADGRSSRIAKDADVPEKVSPNNRLNFFAQYRGLPPPPGARSQIWMLEPDQASVLPNDGGVTIVSCMPSRERLPEFKRDLEGAFVRVFEDLPRGPRLSEGERISKIIGATNLANVSRPVAHPGLALVGDAALWSDPMWAVGCGWAFQSAEWLVEETADALLGGGDLDRALRRYARKHHSRLAGHHAAIASFAKARPYDAIERLMFSAAAKDEKTARHFHAFGSRLIGVRQFLAPRAVGRAMWVNARGARPRRVEDGEGAGTN